MSGSIVVGYTATDAGADALALGARLARSLDAQLDLVIVLPPEGTRSSAVVPPPRLVRARVCLPETATRRPGRPNPLPNPACSMSQAAESLTAPSARPRTG